MLVMPESLMKHMKWGGQFEQEKKDRAGSSYSHSDRNGDILVYSK